MDICGFSLILFASGEWRSCIPLSTCRALIGFATSANWSETVTKFLLQLLFQTEEPEILTASGINIPCNMGASLGRWQPDITRLQASPPFRNRHKCLDTGRQSTGVTFAVSSPPINYSFCHVRKELCNPCHGLRINLLCIYLWAKTRKQRIGGNST